VFVFSRILCVLQLPLESVRKPEYWPDYHPSSSETSSAVPKQGSDFPANPLLHVAGSKVVLGKPTDFPSFGFDNEYGRKEIEVGGCLTTFDQGLTRV
jgi:hypothetical protein